MSARLRRPAGSCSDGGVFAAAPLAPARRSAAGVRKQQADAKQAEPFAFADFTWLTGNPRTKDLPLDSKVVHRRVPRRTRTSPTASTTRRTTPSSARARSSGPASCRSRSSASAATSTYDNVRGRLMTQFGMYSQTTPRNDAEPGARPVEPRRRLPLHLRGLRRLPLGRACTASTSRPASSCRTSGLWSYYQFDNWTYQPSYVSSNTPWFFNGVRVQIFPSDRLKIEPWIVNGWQSYGRFNKAPGVGGQVLWRPNGSVSITTNHYWGTDTLGNPGPEARPHRRQHPGEVLRRARTSG